METGRAVMAAAQARRAREAQPPADPADDRTEPISVGESLRNLMLRSPSSIRRLGESADGKRRGMFRCANIPARHERNKGVVIQRAGGWQTAHDTIVGKLGSGFLYGALGKRGTGKTQIAVNAMTASILADRQPLYVKAMDIFLWIRRTFKNEAVSELDAIADFLCPRLLVIDEIQERGESEWEDRILVHLIDKRYDALHDTLLIGNLKPEEFEPAMGTSIMSRLRECGGLIVCDWPSFRT